MPPEIRAPGQPFRRLPDWEMRLRRYVEDSEFGEFEWGVRDCALWASGALEAMCGYDFAADFRGAYSDAAGAVGVLERNGWPTLLEAASARVGSPPSSVLRAQRGDLVWIPPGIVTDPQYQMGVLGVVQAGIVAPAARRLLVLPVMSIARRGGAAVAVGRGA